MSLRIISLLVFIFSCEGSSTAISGFPNLAKGSAPRRTRETVYHFKLSPVPYDVEVPGTQSSSFGGVGTQFEVLLSPSAPSNNFILQPIQGSSQQPFSSNGPYYIDYQGNLVQRPDNVKPLNFQEAPPVFPHLTDEELTILGQPLSSHLSQDSNLSNSGSLDEVNENENQRPRPGSSLVAGVDNSVGMSTIQDSVGSNPYLLSPAPAFPPLKPSSAPQTQNHQQSTSHLLPTSLQNNQFSTQPHQYISQKPTYSHQYPQNSFNRPQTGTVTPPQSVGLQQQTSPNVQAYQPAALANPSTITGLPLIYKPGPPPVNTVPLPPQPYQIKPSGGVYIATVNNGPAQPSSVFICLQTHLLDPSVLRSGQYSPGPRGYSCKAARGRPLLSNHLLSANSQSPVSQPSVSKEPKPLPTVIPIKFL